MTDAPAPRPASGASPPAEESDASWLGPSRVVLDLAAFKALASETRIDILKKLDERQKTISELAREMDLSKAAVHEHLNVLVETGLVQRLDAPERKWVYYRLTWRGTGLVNPAKKRVAFFLALSTTFFVGGFLYLLVLVHDLVQRTEAFNRLAASAEAGVAVQAARATPVGTFWDLAGAAFVLVTAAVCLALAATEYRTARPFPFPKPDPEPPRGTFDPSEEEPR